MAKTKIIYIAVTRKSDPPPCLVLVFEMFSGRSLQRSRRFFGLFRTCWDPRVDMKKKKKKKKKPSVLFFYDSGNRKFFFRTPGITMNDYCHWNMLRGSLYSTEDRFSTVWGNLDYKYNTYILMYLCKQIYQICMYQICICI